ncbi:Toll/interleukin-1 receptor domain-containing protein [Tanacetum coccineum]
MIFCGCFIEFTIIDAYSPTCNDSCWNKFIIFVGDNCNTTFLWYTVNRTNPRAIRNWINNIGIQEFHDFFLTTSCMFGFNLLYLWTTGFLSSRSCILCLQNDEQIPGMKKIWFFQEYIFQIIRKRFEFEIRRRFFERCLDFIVGVDGDFLEWWFFGVRLDLELSSAVIAMNSSNSEKISSSRRVPSLEWRILLLSVDIKDHMFSPNSKIELLTFNSNNCISSVKKRSSQDEGNFAIFFHFKNNKISRKVSSIQKSFKYDVFLSFRGKDTRKNFVDHLYFALTQKGIETYKDDEKIKQGKMISDELIKAIDDSKMRKVAYKEYIIRLMLAPRSDKASQEKVLKLHVIRKLPGSPSFGGTLF